jgi:hypothetical protein
MIPICKYCGHGICDKNYEIEDFDFLGYNEFGNTEFSHKDLKCPH